MHLKQKALGQQFKPVNDPNMHFTMINWLITHAQQNAMHCRMI